MGACLNEKCILGNGKKNCFNNMSSNENENSYINNQNELIIIEKNNILEERELTKKVTKNNKNIINKNELGVINYKIENKYNYFNFEYDGHICNNFKNIKENNIQYKDKFEKLIHFTKFKRKTII